MDPSQPYAPLAEALVQVATYLCWSMGLVAVVGPAALMKMIRLPARLGVQAVKEEEIGEAPRRWFDELDALLGSQGFRPALTAVATGLSSTNLSRLYVSSGEPTIAVASTVSQASDEGLLAKSYVEFGVEFQDGSSLLTTSVLEQGGIDPHPQSTVFRHGGTRNPLALKKKHDAHLQPLLARGARFYTRGEELIEVIEGDHARKMEYNVARKRWRRLDGGSHYGLTFRNALRVVAQYLNPFSEQAWDMRVAVALLLALVPALGTLVLSVGQLAWLPLVHSLAPGLDPAWAWLLAFAPVAVLGSAVLGVVLEAKATPWVFFLHLAENGALAPDGRSLYQDGAALGVVLLGVKAALWASNFVNSRRPHA